jgi:hypothetical protein
LLSQVLPLLLAPQVYELPQPLLTVPHLPAHTVCSLTGTQAVPPLPQTPGVPPPPQVWGDAHAVIGLNSQLMGEPQPLSTMPHVPAQAAVMVNATQLGGGGSTHLPLFAPVPQTLSFAHPPVSSVQFSTPPQPSPVKPQTICFSGQVCGTQVEATATHVLRLPAPSVSTQRCPAPQLTPLVLALHV